MALAWESLLIWVWERGLLEPQLGICPWRHTARLRQVHGIEPGAWSERQTPLRSLCRAAPLGRVTHTSQRVRSMKGKYTLFLMTEWKEDLQSFFSCSVGSSKGKVENTGSIRVQVWSGPSFSSQSLAMAFVQMWSILSPALVEVT